MLRTGAYRKIALGSLSLYFVVTVGLLYSVTSLWGNPQMAAGYWHLNSPRSADAVGHLANRQLSSMGPQVSMLTLNEFSDQYPAHAYLRLPALVLSCANKPARPHGDAVESLKNSLSRISFAPEVGPMLDDLLNAVHDKECNGVPPGAVKDMILSVFRNPRYSSNTRYSSWHHQLLAKLARNSGDTDEAVRQLTLARSIRPSDDLNLMIVSLLIGDRQFDEARQFLQEVNNDLSFNPIRRVSGKIKLKELRQYVDLVENQH
ncbi:MAG TPA: hypothetical protein PKK10_04255 [Woeseiaceae bacterium]|nr:hypothetical protein [Woeseiaceae bacterium]